MAQAGHCVTHRRNVNIINTARQSRGTHERRAVVSFNRVERRCSTGSPPVDTHVDAIE
jgi:hypothetical protein